MDLARVSVLGRLEASLLFVETLEEFPILLAHGNARLGSGDDRLVIGIGDVVAHIHDDQRSGLGRRRNRVLVFQF